MPPQHLRGRNRIAIAVTTIAYAGSLQDLTFPGFLLDSSPGLFIPTSYMYRTVAGEFRFRPLQEAEDFDFVVNRLTAIGHENLAKMLSLDPQ